LGKYEAKFVVLMYCNHYDCVSAQDYVKIKNSLTTEQFFYLYDLKKQNKWIEKRIEFEVGQENEKNFEVKIKYNFNMNCQHC